MEGGRRRRLLVLCFFPAFEPPASGGELRLVNLYKAVSAHCDVTMLTSTDFDVRKEELFHTPTFREIRFPKDRIWRQAFDTLERSGLKGDLSGLAMALAVSDPGCDYAKTAQAYGRDADAIVHEFPFSEPIFADGRHAVKEIYNAHNFELSLLGSIVDGAGVETALLKLARIEGNLARRASAVLATSTADAEKFRLIHGVAPERLHLCPNGFDDADLEAVERMRPAVLERLPPRSRLLFLGSQHQPNVEGARALIAMAPELPDCEFVIAGTVCHALVSPSNPANVSLIGPFDHAAKRLMLASADLFLNPVVLGSGTSLKAVEALGAGVPMVSTPEGVRGLGLTSGAEAVVVERRAFPAEIRALLAAPERRQRLARTGKAFALDRLTWGRIAEGFVRVLGSAAVAAPGRRPFLLAFNDYPVLDAAWGGKARIRELLGGLDADVVLLSFGDGFDVVRIGPTLLNVTVPKTAEHRAFEQAANEGQPLTVNDCVAALFAGSNRLLETIAADLAMRADAVILEHCYMVPILDAITAVRPDLPVVYSAHNVEAGHRAAMLAEHSAGGAFGAFVADLEARLVRQATLVVCCTEADARHFAGEGAETIVVPNGCVLPPAMLLRSSPAGVPRVGFMGSGHRPNAEAARFIVEDLAPAFPEVLFEFVGGVGDALGDAVPCNVVRHGHVDEDGKSAILAGWTVALNPVASGGGSSLKLPDYMAHGLPTLNTDVGARGFDMVAWQAGVVADRRGFAAALRQMLADRTGRDRMAANARRFAEDRLSWAALVRPYEARFGALLAVRSKAVRARRDRSLLVVTYRYTEPPLGGAEEYLVEVLRRLRSRFRRLDLATVDIGGLTNAYHFGCRVTEAGWGASARIGELFDRAFYFPIDVVPDNQLIERCRRLERHWTRSETDLRLPFAGLLAAESRVVLLGGFYGPETEGGSLWRWTSPSFALLLPGGGRILQLAGWSAAPKTVSLTCLALREDAGPQALGESRLHVDGDFRLNLALPPSRPAQTLVLRFEVDEHGVAGDHRPLGLRVASVALLKEDASAGPSSALATLDEIAADLWADEEAHVRHAQFERWVEALVASSQRRPPDVEEDFAAARGPHSAALQRWLAETAGGYDTVLIQGMPFDVIPRSVETLRRLPGRPRLVTLPHFHGDDRFYHWARYLEAFRAADMTLLFSSSVAARLPVPGRLAVLPGGGVHPEERGDLAATAAFRAVHPGDRPYFLVLGRKTPAKGYGRVVAVHQALHRAGLRTDLVLIGPDEDEAPIAGEGVHYLGRQPRSVVRGALARCVALVSMSASESFGIVLCEAWLFGRPVIANRASYAFRDLVAPGENGLLVGTDEELGYAMVHLATHPAEAARMGERGRAEALERRTWDRVARDVMEALG